MEYYEAADIARKNPGAVMTRDASGTFIVRLTNGEVVGSFGNTAIAADVAHRERKAHLDELSRIQTDFAFREEQLCHEISELDEEISKLKRAVSAEKLDSYQLSQQIETLQAENTSLQGKLAKVSAEEWERIMAADKVIREADIAHKKSELNTVKCSCCGSLENCTRCFGAGEYTIDGLGNRV
jgi:chromosome segregation ATPase